MTRPKIALIGGGQVGGNIALLSAQKELGDIVIVDIPEAENFMKGKALDISQLLPHDGYDSKLTGTIVSPWPPRTMQLTSCDDKFVASAIKALNLALSRAPAIPTTLFFGKPEIL